MGDITGQQIVGGGQSVASRPWQSCQREWHTGADGGFVVVSVPLLGAIIGAGILAAGLAIHLIMNCGCGQTCIVSTGFANQANAALQQNIEAYFALTRPAPEVFTNGGVIKFRRSLELASAAATMRKSCVGGRR